jgi:hypothetical protein
MHGDNFTFACFKQENSITFLQQNSTLHFVLRQRENRMLLLLLMMMMMMMLLILREDTKIDICKSFGLRRRVFAHLSYITSHFSNLAYSCLEDGGSFFFFFKRWYHQM